MATEYRFFAQPKFSGGGVVHLVGYELFVRERQGDHWVLPSDFNLITPADFKELLLATLARISPHVDIVSFNLEQAQFVNPAYRQMVQLVQATTAINIYTELTERPDARVTKPQLLAAARAFHEAGLHVCVDDIGTDANDLDFVKSLLEYVDEYKFAMQNLRPFQYVQEIVAQLKPWYAHAKQNCKKMAIEGIESAADLAYLQQNFPCDILQGYYLGMPENLGV